MSELCNHINLGGDGVTRSCDKPKDHTGWHGQTVELRDGPSTTNWGDDGKGIHASKGRRMGSTWVKA